jgi:shikimate dehydrogenase
MKYFGVVGYPVLHSKSPDFFNPLFEEYGIDAHYTRIAAESINDAMYLFDAIGFDGVNVTTPFKNDAIDSCDNLNEIAKSIGAVNMISNWDGMKVGFNTDYLGVLNTLKRNKFNLKGAKVLLLGGGNAAKAALYAISGSGCELYMVNRNTEKARNLASKFKCNFETIQNLPNIIGNFDLIISTLPNETISIKKEWLNDSQAIIFDANYNRSKLADLAKASKLKYISGLEWLLNQAIPSFKAFVGESVEYNSKYIKRLSSVKDAEKSNIYMIGFMGSGKTSIGRALAEKLNRNFYDIDEMIVESEGCSVYDIFQNKGEEYFRNLETEFLEKLSKTEPCLVSCGGGIILSEVNRKLLQTNAITIWLYSELNTCLNRVKPKTRPLLAVDNPFQIAKKIFAERKDLYFSCSDLLVNSEKPLQKVIDRLFEEFTKSGYYGNI